MAHTVSVILNVRAEQADEFEREFREHEYPVWGDLIAKGAMVRASLQRLWITSHEVEGAVQFMVVAVFPGKDHEAHDSHPRFKKWNERAERFQIAEPLAFGGDTILQVP